MTASSENKTSQLQTIIEKKVEIMKLTYGPTSKMYFFSPLPPFTHYLLLAEKVRARLHSWQRPPDPRSKCSFSEILYAANFIEVQARRFFS